MPDFGTAFSGLSLGRTLSAPELIRAVLYAQGAREVEEMILGR